MALRRRLDELDEADRLLVESAAKARSAAYAPYSDFLVGAAARSSAGKIHSGANLENASYGVTMCAEVAALTRSNTDGDYCIEALAVAGGPASGAGSAIVTPCGRCRQMILEASHVSGVDIRVLSCSGDLSSIIVAPISELLPFGFGPKNLDD